MTSTRTIEWMSQGGQTITVTISVSRELREVVVNADGDMINTGRMELRESTSLIATVGGKVVGNSSYISNAPRNAPAGIVGVIGHVGMTTGNKTRIETAIAEATAEVTTPEIATHIEAERVAMIASDQADVEYRAHCAAVENMMTLGGRTF